jgi:hypothetical protein
MIDPSCRRLINGFLGGYCYPEIGGTGYHRDSPEKNKFSHVHDALQYLMAPLLRNYRRKVDNGGEPVRIGGKQPPKTSREYREVYA